MMPILFLYLSFCSVIPRPVIHPTYTCYKDSFDYLRRMIREDKNLSEKGDVYLVHGTCEDIRKEYGHKYFHSWIEVKNGKDVICIYAVNYNGKFRYVQLPRGNFYSAYGVLQVKRYLPYQAYGEFFRSGIFGPWAEDPGVVDGMVKWAGVMK